MKFVIWGVGTGGKRALNDFTKDKVCAFIENNVKLQGTQYKGIPVISYSDYKKKYLNVPIIVSPLYFAHEILELLSKDGIDWAFSYYEHMNSILGFLRQGPIDRIIQNYKTKDNIYIYGFNPLGILMYDYFIEKGFECKLLLQHSTSEKTRKYVKNKTEMNLEDITDIPSKSKILLALNLEKEDKINLASDINIENYVDIGLRRELYYNPKLEKFRNIHNGKRCFIVATGPSLKMEDLDILHKNKEICISVNSIFKGFNKTQWRPDYYVISDPLVVVDEKKEILNMNVKAKFISDIAWQFEQEELADSMYCWHFHRAEIGEEGPEFSDDFAKCGILGGTVIYDGALPLAVYMGFKEIYLLGVDCNYLKGSRNNYFVKSEKEDNIDHQEDKMILAYKAAKKYTDSHGIKIYNATRGGALEVFERVDFDSLFE